VVNKSESSDPVFTLEKNKNLQKLGTWIVSIGVVCFSSGKAVFASKKVRKGVNEGFQNNC